MPSRVIINLSPSRSQVLGQLAQLVSDGDSDTGILDITGAVCNETYPDVVLLEDISDSQIEDEALEDYSRFVVDCSHAKDRLGRSAREILFAGIPLFWMSALAVKHPVNHWGHPVFRFGAFCRIRQDFFKGVELMEFVLPANGNRLPAILKALVSELDGTRKRRCVFHRHGVIKNSVLVKFIRSWSLVLLKKLRAVGSRRPIDNSVPSSDQQREHVNIFALYQPEKLHEQNSLDREIAPLVKHTVDTIDVRLISHGSDSPMNIDPVFYHARPGIFRTAILFVQCFATYLWIRICFIRNIAFPNSFTIQGALIAREFGDLMANAGVMELGLQLKSYLAQMESRYQSVHVFYTNEFYTTGRLISQTANCGKSVSFGIQHGNFFKRHTVYRITDEEMEGQSGLPVPDHFVVWGEHFKELFQRNNSLNQEVIPAGNPRYVFSASTARTRGNGRAGNTVLWCTTNLLQTIEEAKLLDAAFEDSACQEVQIRVRLHPGKHVSESELNNLLSKRLSGRVHFDTEPDLFKSMESAGAVCTSFHSSIFLDAIQLSIPVARLYPSRRTRDMDDEIAGIHHVVEPEELRKFFTSISQFESENHSQCLYLKNDRWLEILNESPR